MEASYLQENKRDLELTKHISMAMIKPGALLDLKKDGKCIVEIPEALFDLDYPGHYFRRIKSVSITIPCVTGPFTTVNCTLQLNKHWTRVDTTVMDNYYDYDTYEATSIRNGSNQIQTIACSSAQNDSGLFELNFRDERYLPFEGCGAISEWTLELTKNEALRQFDYKTISDVIFHIKYTAKKDGRLKGAVEDFLAENLSSLPGERVFSARHEFPSEWYRFLHSTGSDDNVQLKLPVTKEMFPFFVKDKTLNISKFDIFIKCKQETAAFDANLSPFMKENEQVRINPSEPKGWLMGRQVISASTLSQEPWVLSLPAMVLDAEIEDIYLGVAYDLG